VTRNILTVPIQRVDDGATATQQDLLAVEEPLEIRVRANGELKTISVTMRTPGHDRELATGFLFSEGITGGETPVRKIRAEGNRIKVEVDGAVDFARLERHFYTTSSCGGVRKNVDGGAEGAGLYGAARERCID
jgi:FdhD protein